MTGRNVALLMGGWSPEREVSLSSGRECAKALVDHGYAVRSIDVGRDLPALLRALEPRPDLVFNALHGVGGEDGTVQAVLDLLGMPYTHSGVLASALAMHKPTAKEVFRAAGLPVVEGVVVSAREPDGGRSAAGAPSSSSRPIRVPASASGSSGSATIPGARRRRAGGSATSFWSSASFPGAN